MWVAKVKKMSELDKKENEVIQEDNKAESNEKQEPLSESETDNNIELEAMGNNKIVFLSKEEISKM